MSARAGASRPPFPPEVRAEVKALACELPAASGLPLSRFSSREIARAAVARGIVCEISGATVWRWLGEDAVKPFALSDRNGRSRPSSSSSTCRSTRAG